ncbi:MAG: hypothetical protein QXJ74_06495 [Nitrososphaera sp.]
MVTLPINPDMMIGMVIGMAASPLLMKVARSLYRKRRIDRLLNEIARNRSIVE